MHTLDLLKHINSFREECRVENKKLEREEILKKYDTPEFREILIIIETYVMNITEKTMRENWDDRTFLEKYKETKYNNFPDLCKALKDRDITGYDALKSIYAFIDEYIEYKELIILIIKGNLGIGMSKKMINAVYGDIIEDFSVALADKWSSKLMENKQFFVSHKLDGVRLLIIVEDGSISFKSRSGKVYHCFEKLEETIQEHIVDKGIDNIVFDGEVCIMTEKTTEDGETFEAEDFTAIQGEIRKKDYTIEKPMYFMFDSISLEDFKRKEGTETFEERVKKLRSLGSNIRVLEQTLISSESELESFITEAKKYEWEGLILRDASSTYKGKRSKDILKYKIARNDTEDALFQVDQEYVVLNTRNSTITVIEDSVYKEEEMLAAIEIEHEGCKVEVGSGFTREERRKYYKNPEKIIGQTITVAYTEFTPPSEKNKFKASLRFPIYKGIRDYE